jgi:YesN/AraC family two-component response regulator
LLSFVLSTVYGPPPKKERVLEREESLYREILECPDSGSMIGWFKRFVGQASDDHSDPEQGTGAHPHHVDRILHIMESNVAADISLSSVAESLGLNPAYVSRLFKQATGQTFMEYMTAIRIEKSKLLLVRTELKIREVGRQVGYNQDYYFIRLFKDHTGVTPGEYRKKMRGS